MPEIYHPYTMDYLISKSFIVRTSMEPASLAGAVRRAILEIDPMQPLRANGADGSETITMNEVIARSVAAPRFNSLVMVVLAVLAMLLAAIGLFALVSVTVTERTREIGLRMALGAARPQVFRWILGWTARIALLAMTGGIALVLVAGRALEAWLFGTKAHDPVILALSASAFFAIAIAATLVPALRATRIDPVRVLSD